MKKVMKRDFTAITLRNKINDSTIKGKMIEMQDIEGKQFYVVEVNGRVVKLAKDGHTVQRG